LRGLTQDVRLVLVSAEPGHGVSADRRQLVTLGPRVVREALHELTGRAGAAKLRFSLDMQDGAPVALDGVVGPDKTRLAVRIGETLFVALFGRDVAKIGHGK